MNATTWTTDNRWSPGTSGADVPDDAPAAYSARWIDHGSHEKADILPDRQGFAYNDTTDRDALIKLLSSNTHRIRSMGSHDHDVTYEVDVMGAWRIFQRRVGGYVYVDAWLTPAGPRLFDSGGHIMNILREWLGGSEVIDFDTDEGWHSWVHGIVQDDELAEELRDRIAVEGEVVVNDNEPEFIERYTRLDAPWFRDADGQIVYGQAAKDVLHIVPTELQPGDEGWEPFPSPTLGSDRVVYAGDDEGHGDLVWVAMENPSTGVRFRTEAEALEWVSTHPYEDKS